MLRPIDDLRIRSATEVIPPSELLHELPVSEKVAETVSQARETIQRMLRGEDKRLLAISGPCSIHDVEAAREYAGRLLALKQSLQADLFLVMRVYFEKPRTTVGWKGLINDPGLDGSFRINDGLRLARRLLLDLGDMSVPTGTEYLDPISPQYVADLIAWGAIGARTTESQVHRELASGLSCPIGFKNATDGGLQTAVDAIVSASHAHHFLGVTKSGHSAILATRGNPDCHIILRGGNGNPNYDAESVEAAACRLQKAGLRPQVVIDCSHANSGKDPDRQVMVCHEVAAQIAGGEKRILGVMLESHLLAGRQDLVRGSVLTYGQSITDACMSWENAVDCLRKLAEAVRRRNTLR
ncbi:MAG: 3-deoxy-7-phosphoheptulonate synthase [Gammaproteobacteria bacterium]